MSMLVALIDNDPCKRIHINDYRKELHSGKIFCCYGHEVLAKQGAKKCWHFAHVSATDSDCAKLMGDWHHWWQDRVMTDFLEVVIVRDGVKHRADMINGDDIVVEFQKSVINQQIIIERETFYGDMIWVVCCDENHTHKVAKQIGRFVKIRMLGGSKFFMDMRKKTFLDFGFKGVVEVIKYRNTNRAKPEVLGKIWTQWEFDETFMRGCLREDADRRIHRPPYEFDEIDKKFEEIEGDLIAK